MKRLDLPSLALLFTLALFGVAGLWPIESMWGFNHLAFLPIGWTYAYFVVCAVVLFLIFYPRPILVLERSLDSVSVFLFERGWWPKVAVALGFGVLFWLFRAETHFLGDGYTLLSIFGQGESFIHRPAEPGSALLIRGFQYILGGYTRETTYVTLSTLSFVSGFITILGFFSLSHHLGTDLRTRFYLFVSFVSSGIGMLFFGYIEYYPLLWAPSVWLIAILVRPKITRRYFFLAISLFVFACLMHLQAAFFLPVLILTFLAQFVKVHSGGMAKGWSNALSVIGGLSVLALSALLLANDQSISTPFLPILSSIDRPYSLFGLDHLLDLVNESFLVWPGILFMFAIGLLNRGKELFSFSIQRFVILASGPLMFLLVIDPKLGMARDWDLMSLAAFVPILLLLKRGTFAIRLVRPTSITAYLLVASLVTGSFVATNRDVEASEHRFDSLVKYNSNSDETGRVILTYYYLNKGDNARAREYAEYLVKHNSRKADIYNILGILSKRTSDWQSAKQFFRRAISMKPYQPRYWNELGQVLLQLGRYEEAIKVFRQARELDPSLTFVPEGIALTYIRMGDYNEALLMADTLLMANSDSPGGHLIKMVVAINQGDMETARVHYLEYVKYGTKRSDYQRIRKTYGEMFE